MNKKIFVNNSPWFCFKDKLPQIGDDIEVSFDDKPNLVRTVGKVQRILTKEQITGTIIAEDSLENSFWSITGSDSVNGIVRPEYKWRFTSVCSVCEGRVRNGWCDCGPSGATMYNNYTDLM
jgi:hypothetical protein